MEYVASVRVGTSTAEVWVFASSLIPFANPVICRMETVWVLLLRVQFDEQLQVLDNSSYPDTKLQRGGRQWDVQVVPGGVLLGQQPVQPGAHHWMRHLQQEDRLVL